MTNLRYAVFDFNGTLTNDAEIGFDSCNHMLEWYGVPKVSFTQFLDTFVIPWIGFYTRNGVLEEDIDIKTHQDVYQKHHKQLMDEKLQLKEGVTETLYYLKEKGVQLGVLSARNQSFLREELEKLGIAKMFDAIVGEENFYDDGTKIEKNTDRLLKQMNIEDNSQVLYVGDMVIDINIAREYGFTSGITPTGWQSKKVLLEQKPDHVFETFYDIKKLFD